MSLSIILPTINRPSLRAAIESAIPQLKFADELIVIGHGVLPEAAYITSQYPKTRYFEDYTDSGRGADRRNLGMNKAYGGHFVYLDDDDVLAPKALELIRTSIKKYPEYLIFHRMEVVEDSIGGCTAGTKIWMREEIALGNTICANMVVPNIISGPRWTAPVDRNGDEEWSYLQACSVFFPHIFVDAVTHYYRPQDTLIK
jgi:glycosyltransferase involved in cell wall biosynthesis